MFSHLWKLSCLRTRLIYFFGKMIPWLVIISGKNIYLKNQVDSLQCWEEPEATILIRKRRQPHNTRDYTVVWPSQEQPSQEQPSWGRALWTVARTLLRGLSLSINLENWIGVTTQTKVKMMKPSQTFKKESTQEQVRKRNKERGPKTRQAKEPQRGDCTA